MRCSCSQLLGTSPPRASAAFDTCEILFANAALLWWTRAAGCCRLPSGSLTSPRPSDRPICEQELLFDMHEDFTHRLGLLSQKFTSTWGWIAQPGSSTEVARNRDKRIYEWMNGFILHRTSLIYINKNRQRKETNRRTQTYKSLKNLQNVHVQDQHEFIIMIISSIEPQS